MRGWNGHLDLIGLPRLHLAQGIVGVAVRAHVQAVRVQIGRVEAIRQVVVVRLRIAVRRQLIDEADAQHVAGTRTERGAGRHSIISAHVELVPADVLIRIADTERGA